MHKIAADPTTSFEDAVGICSAVGWKAQFSDRAKTAPLLYWVLLKDGRTFGIVEGTGNLQVADFVLNFQKYVFSD
ncbi:MAG: hypothetical protein ACYCYK_14315 [Candidatus Dormibacteria bacterium]